MLQIISCRKKLWTSEEKLEIIDTVFAKETKVYVHYNLGRGKYREMQELFDTFKTRISRETNTSLDSLEFRISACTDGYSIGITNPEVIPGYLELDTHRAELYFINCDKSSAKEDIAVNFHSMVAYVPEEIRSYLEERGFKCRITRKKR